MKYLFVKADAIGSKIIRWGLKSKSSHFAICFDEDLGGDQAIVFHSYGTRGTHLLWLSEFMERYTIVEAVEHAHALDLAAEERVYRAIIAKGRATGYDFKALAWWAIRGAMWLALRIPIPKKNAWQQDGYSLCTKLAEGPLAVSGMDTSKIDFEAISLDDLHTLMLSGGQFVAANDWASEINLAGLIGKN